MTEYLSKKIYKETEPVLKYVQAHLQIEKGEKVTEPEVFNYVMLHVAKEQYGYLKEKNIRKGLGLLKYAGIIKGGPRTNAKEIDEVVYGV